MAESRAPTSVPTNAVYNAFWRWHFYAGLLVMPLLMMMALTGGVYLFKDEIESAWNRPLLKVAPSSNSAMPQAWADAALSAAPGRLVQVVPPETADRSARLVIEQDRGRRMSVFVDPHTAKVLGSAPENGLMLQVKRLHSLDIAGPVFNLLVEVVAGWAIVMVATGIVLWWPRGQSGGAVSVRGSPAKRMFWRDTHAVTGIFTGVVIVFLAVTGMPWSAVWGKEVRKFTTEAGWGRPAAPTLTQGSTHDPAHDGHTPAVPWALQETEVHSAHDGHTPGLSLDAAVARLDEIGLPRPYILSISSEPGKAWSASYIPAQADRMRTVYLASSDGGVLADIGYDQFGPAAKAIEWGIAVHQGNQFGLANKLVMLAGCIAIWVLGVSALIMWWKRRPKGRLAPPPRPGSRKAYSALAAVVIPLSVLYPLVGASLVVVLGLDLLLRRIIHAKVAA